MDEAGHLRRQQGGQRRAEAAHIYLPFNADVQQAGAQRHNNGETGEQDRRGLHEGAAKAIVVKKCPAKQGAVSGKRIDAGHRDEAGAKQQGGQHRPQRAQQIEAADEFQHQPATASLSPPMSEPMRSLVACSGGRMPVIWPAHITAI